MNVLVDFIGHIDLFTSMQLLFQKRLGWELYRPDGEGQWKDWLYWHRHRIGVDDVDDISYN